MSVKTVSVTFIGLQCLAVHGPFMSTAYKYKTTVTGYSLH